MELTFDGLSKLGLYVTTLADTAMTLNHDHRLKTLAFNHEESFKVDATAITLFNLVMTKNEQTVLIKRFKKE